MVGNIMIIDDSPVDRRITRQILEKKLPDINLLEAEDGQDINQKLILNNVHMCILDIMMPFMDGFQVLKTLKEDPALMDIPVIVCTGMEDKQTIEKALTLGAYDYFSKPLSEEAMKISLPLKVKNAMELMKRKEEIIYLSYHDKLTGLYNRRFYEEQIKRLDNAENLPVTIIMGDANGLKLTNDSFGHEAGDKLLIKIAQILKSECEKNGGFIARIGGDEFVIVLPNTGIEEAEKTMERIKNKCDNENEDPIRPSISMGFSTKEYISQDISSIYRSAEDRMYSFKLMESKNVRSSILSSLRKTFFTNRKEMIDQDDRIWEISSGSNITEARIRIEELICTNMQLTELNTLRNSIFSNVSHDIRNSMANMVSVMELLEEDYCKSDISEIVHEVSKQVKSNFLIFDSLLERLNNQKDRINSTNVFLIVKEALVSIENTIKVNNIEIINNIGDNVTLLTDMNIFGIVIQSIFDYSLKFLKKGDLISIYTRQLEKKVILVIRDSGISTNSDKIKILFPEAYSNSGTSVEEVNEVKPVIVDSKDFIKHNREKSWIDGIVSKGNAFYFFMSDDV